jgi:hypothetical protein
VALPQHLRDDQVEGLPQCLGRAMPENQLRPPVPVADDSFPVGHQNGISGSIEQFLELSFHKPSSDAESWSHGGFP